MIKKKQLYFQKQSSFSAQCGICALNNLIGVQMFQSSDLDQICRQLSTDMINPYKSVFGGDYDVSVLIKALQKIQFPVRWLKKNQVLSEVLSQKLLKGILINTEQKSNLFIKRLMGRSGRHWTCIRKIHNDYILMDSIKQKPQILDNRVCQNILQKIRQDKGTILLIQLKSAQKIQEQQNK